MTFIAIKADWIARCARHFRTGTGMSAAVSIHFAEACWLNALDEHGSEAAILAASPEDAAEEELRFLGRK